MQDIKTSPLPVGEILRKSYASLWHYKADLLRISWLWGLLALAFVTLMSVVTSPLPVVVTNLMSNGFVMRMYDFIVVIDSVLLSLWIMGSCYYFCDFSRKRFIILVCILAIIIIVVAKNIELLNYFFYVSSHGTSIITDFSLFALSLLFSLPVMFLIASIATAWHQHILEKNPSSAKFYLGAGHQVRLYFWAFLMFYVLDLIISSGIDWIDRVDSLGYSDSFMAVWTYVSYVIFLVSSLFIYSMFGLVLPMIALSNKGSSGIIRNGFLWGKGNRGRLFLIQFVAFFPVFVVSELHDVFRDGGVMASNYHYTVEILYIVLTSLASLVGLSALSLCYQSLQNQREGAGSQ